jgi:adenosylcobinamide kinase/adenosylcobinamide-phosphate guanylyltransferase
LGIYLLRENNLIFILGGARSGKSQFAENWAWAHGSHVLYVATAQAQDDDMQARIAHHRAQRPAQWHTLEAPRQTAQAVTRHLKTATYDTILVDCVTILAANILLGLPEDCSQQQVNEAIIDEINALMTTIEQSTATWLVISNEVGLGVVPPTVLGRHYRDALGRANQRIAKAADRVILMIAGLPWKLKPFVEGTSPG